MIAYAFVQFSDYSPPNGVFNFFICFSTSEWVTIASYLGYRQEELDPIVKGSPEDREQQVRVHCKHEVVNTIECDHTL